MQNPAPSGARGAPHLHKEQICHNIQLFKASILYPVIESSLQVDPEADPRGSLIEPQRDLYGI
jgi:hypothetical protein